MICSAGFEATLCCLNDSCEHMGLICVNSGCKCLKESHPWCSYGSLDTLVKSVKAKNKAAQVQQIYDQAIARITQDKVRAFEQMKNLGLHQLQMDFLEYCQKGTMSSLKGSFFYKIRNLANTDSSCEVYQQATEQFFRMKQCWEKQKHNFHSIFDQLSRCAQPAAQITKLFFEINDTQDQFEKSTEGIYRSESRSAQISEKVTHFSQKKSSKQRKHKKQEWFTFFTDETAIKKTGKYYFDCNLVSAPEAVLVGITNSNSQEIFFSGTGCLIERSSYFNTKCNKICFDNEKKQVILKEGVRKDSVVRTIIDMDKKIISWLVNTEEVGRTELSPSFLSAESFFGSIYFDDCREVEFKLQ